MTDTESTEKGASRWHSRFLWSQLLLIVAWGVLVGSVAVETEAYQLLGILFFGAVFIVNTGLYFKLFHAYYVDAKELSERDAPYQPAWGYWAFFHTFWAPIVAIIYILRRDKRLRTASESSSLD